MRAMAATFLILAYIPFAYAELKSADEFKQDCITQRINHCVTSTPTADPDAPTDTSKCSTSSMLSFYDAQCVDATQAYCASYDAVLATGVPGGTAFKVPNGCNTSVTSTSTPIEPPDPKQPYDIGKNITAARADLQKCQSMHTTAQTCCGNPASCGGKSATGDLQKLEDLAQDAEQDNDNAGLDQICSQASKAADANVDLNSSYASVCAAKHLSCSDACGQALDKWNLLAKDCTGTSCSELSSVVSQMWSQRSACTQLTANEQTLQDKATQQAINSRIGTICLNRVKADPTMPTSPSPSPSPSTPQQWSDDSPRTRDQIVQQNYYPQQQMMPQTQAQAAGAAAAAPVAAALPVGSSECGTVGNIGSCVNCAEHPEYPSCGGGGSMARDANSGMAQNDSAQTASVGGTSNVGAGASSMQHQGFSMPSSGAPMNANPAANANAMMNASGNMGIFPPINSKDLSGSLLDRARYIAAKNGVNTDIFHGERGGGGGYSARATGSGFESRRRSLASFGNGVAANDKSYQGMDLKRYLPNAIGMRRGVNGMGIAQSEIGPMSTDMFQRVSLRFKLICLKHTLLDCN
jgi:hypothetical protein